MPIRLVDTTITRSELALLAASPWACPRSGSGSGSGPGSSSAEPDGCMVKVVVDLGRRVLAVGAAVHAEARDFLVVGGSRREDLWGARIYFRGALADSLEYVSNINKRTVADGFAAKQNLSIKIMDPAVREDVLSVLRERVDWER